ncbi:MAG: hypothetical protein E6Q97_07380 [Desulfurellales bacterium]|nr:MAG: hypothetical protein E6Q97_07380 [Desulfurellales bacterium]
MNLIVPFTVLAERHPEMVALVQERMKTSKSKDPDVDPTHFEWRYDWGLEVGPDASQRPLADRMWVSIQARKGRKIIRSRLRLVPTPPELIAALEVKSED